MPSNFLEPPSPQATGPDPRPEALLQSQTAPASCDYFQRAIELLPDGILVLTQERIRYANAAAARQLGYPSPQAMLGQEISRHIPTIDLTDLHTRAAVETDEVPSTGQETTLTRCDGSRLSVELGVAWMRFGAEVALQLHLRVKPREQQIERIFETVRRATAGVCGREFFQSLVREVGPFLNAIRIFVGQIVDRRTQRIRTVAHWNAAGYTEYVEEFTPQITSPALETLQIGYCEVDGTLSMREPERADFYRAAGVDSYMALSLRAADGRTLGYISVKYSRQRPLIPHATAILQLFASRASAELERLEIEEALRTSETRFRALSDSSPVGIFQLDHARQCTYVNQRWSEITGMTAQAARGDGWMESLHPDDRARVLATRAANAGDYNAERRFVNTEGQVRWVSVRVRVLHQADGKIFGYVGTMDDVTERVMAAEEIKRLNSELERRVIERTTQLEAANAELESFSYSVSHDLRSPLRAIDGFSRAIEEDYQDRLDETGCDYLRRIRYASQHMGHLIDDLIRLSRASRMEMHREKIDLAVLAADVQAELRVLQPQHAVAFECAPELWAFADRALARIVLQNLLSNAWKYTRRQPAPKVELATLAKRDTNDAQIFVVRDNGAGFDMRYVNKLFTPFQRLHSANDFEGTGIGLATVRRIVARHGGRAWAESAPGQGAAFYFTFGENPPLLTPPV
ncbi:MAG: PAS domain S-box protein [Opitutae bacterium]|nr:PAS domain S-box protein [Opitutae bacterium]